MFDSQALHCVGVLLGLREAATQLSVNETTVLEQLAEASRLVVEIGVFEGVTTRRMIERMPEGSTIYGVDPFLAGRLGLAYGYWISRYQIWRAHRSDVRAVLLRRFSFELAREFNEAPDLVFIDADHRYDEVFRDWHDWSPKIRPGGCIALHDSQPMVGRCPENSGPVRLVKELGQSPPGFTLLQVQDTLSVYRRVNG